MRTALATLALLTATLIGASPSTAHVVEAPVRALSAGETLELRYVEPVPTARHPHRVYFELNDGSAYRHMNARVCLKSNEVPNDICADVFWYAR